MQEKTKAIVQCGHCLRQFRVDANKLGQTARCPKCHHRFHLAPKPTLDDSVLDWLLEDEESDTVPDRPETRKSGTA